MLITYEDYPNHPLGRHHFIAKGVTMNPWWDIYQWVTDQFGAEERDTDLWTIRDGNFIFKDDDQALHFRMRWC